MLVVVGKAQEPGLVTKNVQKFWAEGGLETGEDQGRFFFT